MKIRAMILLIAGMLLYAAAGTAAAMEEKTIARDGNLITLERAIETAYQSNLDIRQAETSVVVARGDWKYAKAKKGFTFGFSGNYTQTINATAISFPMHMHLTSGVVNATSITMAGFPTGAATMTVAGSPYEFSVDMMDKLQKGANFTFGKPVWTFGLIPNGIRMARKGVQSSDLDVVRTRQNVALQVKQAYYGCLLSLEALDVANETMKQAKTHYDAAKARFDAGVSPKIDIISADMELASARESIMTAQKNVELALMGLNNAMGIDVNAPTRVAMPDASEEITTSPEALIAMALERRAELKKIKLGQDVQTLLAKNARLLPTIGFGGAFTMLNKGSAFGQEDTWNLQLQASLPVFDSGASRAKIRQAKAAREKLVQTEQQVRSYIELQVRNAYNTMNEAKARRETSAAILDQAKEYIRMTELGYKEGVRSNLEVVDAEHALSGAKINNARARYDYEQAKAALLNAVGAESEKELNKGGH